MSHENHNLDMQNIELLIDKKIADAKLEVSEKRFNFVLKVAAAMFALFGFLLPYYSASQNDKKVDTAIEKMKLILMNLQKSN